MAAVAAVAEPELELTGAQRAAILVMYLKAEVARSLLERMSSDEIRSIGLAMAEVERVDPEVIEKVVADFVRDLHRISLVPKTGRDFALGVLPSLVDEDRRPRVYGSLKRNLSTEFEEYIAAKPPRAVAAILADEHAQTQAVALMLMGPENAACIMALMDEQDQYDLALRMAKLKQVPGELADDVETAMRQALEADDAERWAVKGVDRAAQILGRLGKPMNEAVLVRLAKNDKKLSETLRRRMVVFADLDSLDDRAAQALLKEIERQDLLLALKGATTDMQDLFLRNMSSRAAADIRDELEIMGPTPKSMVERAQENIVASALRLQEEGLIFLAMGGADELV